MPDHIKVIDTDCPHCGKHLTSSTNVGDGERGPEPGDPSICNRCAKIAAFSPEMKLVVVPPETLAEWQAIPELWCEINLAIATVKTRKHYDPSAA